MSSFQILHGSCADQTVDAVVNAANRNLRAGGGICGAIFARAGMEALTAECEKHSTPLRDGDAVMTSACRLHNAKAIIHAVGPDFRCTPDGFQALFDAYYHSLQVLMDNGLHSISFPLISAGIFSGNLPNPAAKSTRQCCRAYRAFTADHPDYDLMVYLCAYSRDELEEAQREFAKQ